MRSLTFLASTLLSLASAKTVEYNWNITWVYAAPDGFTRPVIGINGAWPLPTLEAEVGDRVIVNMDNQLGNRSVSLHYHGLFMNGTTQMDGPSQVNQCRSGNSGQFVYDFEITQPGTYWYHAHVDAQYPDGLRGPLIIHDPASPYIDAYNASNEVVLTLSDWYHDFAANLRNSYISLDDPTGAEPIPDNALMNDAQNVDFDVLPGQTYFFRIVNMGAFASQYFWIEDHNMTIIEVDGVYTDAQEVEMIYVTPAQRYGVLITMKNDTSTNYPIVASMDTSLFDTLPPTLDYNVTGWLVYDTLASRSAPAILEEFDPYDDFQLVPYDKLEMYENVDQNIELTFEFNNLDNGANYAFFNNVTYVSPLVPTLYTALSTGQDALNPAVYGSNTNAFVLGKNQVVQIVVNSLDTGKHPFHLHGHNFQVVARGEENAGVWNYTESDLNIQHPMRRDTYRVEPGSYIVLRFVSDNPDKSLSRVWLFHCHIEWHMMDGLAVTMVEDPLALQSSFSPSFPATFESNFALQNITVSNATALSKGIGLTSIPASHIQTCEDEGIPYAGNAAANTNNALDLTGENSPPAGPIPAGFTARGIVALVFSCISAFVGMAVIVWYGSGELANHKQDKTEDVDEKSEVMKHIQAM